MKKVYIFLADGFEDVEGLTVVDLLRRAEIDVVTVSIKDTVDIVTSHNIHMQTDTIFSENNYDDADMLVLPGGMPGTKYLGECKPLCDLLKKHYEKGTKLAAICAAPTVFAGLGFLLNRKATSYPSCERDVYCAEYLQENVVRDENITTSRGVGTAIEFALTLITELLDRKTAKDIADSIVYNW